MDRKNILSRLSGVFLAALPLFASATQLSHNLTSGEIKKTARVLGLGSIHRYYTAHGLPTTGLGVEFGLENLFLFRRNILDMGDQTAVAPRVVPVPRLWFSWDLPKDFILSGSFGPGFLFDGISTYALGLQWTFYDDPDIATKMSWANSLSGVEAFGDMNSHSLDSSFQVSRDLVFWQPYAGAGLILNTSAVKSSLAAAGVDSRYFLPATHFYAGARIDLVAKLALQMDLMNDLVSFSVLLSTSF